MRWPMHPVMIPGERLSSWLRRIGLYYGVSVDDLLKSLGSGLKASQIDVRASGKLIETIKDRTGESTAAIRTTTFARMFPRSLLRKSRVARGEDRSLSVLWESSKHRNGRPREIRWIRRERGDRLTACRECLADYPNAGVMLAWGLSVVFSCPVHQILLEPAEVGRKTVTWLSEQSQPAPVLISMLDRRNYSALLEGIVDLPGRIVGDEYWFRLLQAIFQELEHSVDTQNDERWQRQQVIWGMAGYSPRGFGERFEFDMRCAKLVATAIDQMENGHVFPTGTEGRMFSEQKNQRWKAAQAKHVASPESCELHF
jgi:hypothetical protein